MKWLIVVLVVIAILVLVSQRQHAKQPKTPSLPPPPPQQSPPANPWLTPADGSSAGDQPQVAGGGPLPPEVLNQIRELALSGRKIEAIKLMRQHSNLGLKEAKDIVDSIR